MHLNALAARIAVIFVVASTLLSLPGCNKPAGPGHVPNWQIFGQNNDALMTTASTHPDPAMRRDAIAKLSSSATEQESPGRETLMRIARSDANSGVRVAAIRALARHPDMLTVHTMLAILQEPRGNGSPGAPAAARWEAVRVLRNMRRDGLLEETAYPEIRKCASRLLETDSSRDVRICAACLLGYDLDIQAAYSLAGALRQKDFAVVYEANRSLTRLTGQSLGYSARDWSTWLESSPDPFAESPLHGRPEVKPWWLSLGDRR